MPRFFHQNMRVFGGGAGLRNDAFAQALDAIHGVWGDGFWVAGFTEVTNSRDGCREAVQALAPRLDPRLIHQIFVAVGITAVGAKTEYVGIVWNPDHITIEYAGVVLMDNLSGKWTAFPANDVAGVLPPSVGLPVKKETLNADSRGLAYVAGYSGGQRYVVGFMHNMFQLGDKTGAYDNIPTMTKTVLARLAGAYGNANLVVGGDFNLSPRDPGTQRTRQGMYCVAALDPVHGGYANTTAVNPYDYFLVNIPGLGNANVGIAAQTRGVGLGLSDHAGLVLNF